MLRKLRLGAAGLCCVAFIGFGALWIRSYWVCDHIFHRDDWWSINPHIENGKIGVYAMLRRKHKFDDPTSHWISLPADPDRVRPSYFKSPVCDFYTIIRPDHIVFNSETALLLPALIAGVAATLLGTSSNFCISLKKLLGAVTLVAVALGLLSAFAE